jgi:hypothetical protein
MFYKIDTKGELLKEINNPSISKIAKFKLDKPLACTLEDLFLLYDGQWFILRGDFIRLQGRWVDERAGHTN